MTKHTFFLILIPNILNHRLESKGESMFKTKMKNIINISIIL